MEIRVEGIRELARSLRAVDRDLPKALGPLHKEVAEPVARTAEGLAPKRSGRMAGNIRALGSQRAGQIAVGKKAIPYAGPIHYGWPAHNIRPQPFLTDALEANSQTIATDYERLLGEFLDRVWATI